MSELVVAGNEPHACQPPRGRRALPLAAGLFPLASADMVDAVWRCGCGRYWLAREVRWQGLVLAEWHGIRRRKAARLVRRAQRDRALM